MSVFWNGIQMIENQLALSRASKESTPSDVSGVSLDPKSISFSQIKSDRKPVVKSCNTESSLPLSTKG